MPSASEKIFNVWRGGGAKAEEDDLKGRTRTRGKGQWISWSQSRASCMLRITGLISLGDVRPVSVKRGVVLGVIRVASCDLLKAGDGEVGGVA